MSVRGAPEGQAQIPASGRTQMRTMNPHVLPCGNPNGSAAKRAPPAAIFSPTVNPDHRLSDESAARLDFPKSSVRLKSGSASHVTSTKAK